MNGISFSIEMLLQIKNMVCPRCVASVTSVLDELGISYQRVELGTVELSGNFSDNQKSKLAASLESLGFELLSSAESKLINDIKTFIINKVHYSKQHTTINLSKELSALLHKDYSVLSKAFSRKEGITIEQFLITQRIEKVKELLSYNEMTISEIADVLGYSSVSHLSGQFKKMTGMSASVFRKLPHKPRITLDKL